MKMTRFTLLAFLCSVFLISCDGRRQTDVLTGQVTLEGYEGKTVYLETTGAKPSVADSAQVIDGRFSFILNDSVPHVYCLVLRKSSDDLFPITLPIVSEKGHIQVVMGELVLTMGTPLNDSLQDFLLSVSHYRERILQNKDAKPNMIREGMSKLIEDAVMRNLHTPVGIYIYRFYIEFLNETQRQSILNRADAGFKKAINQ